MGIGIISSLNLVFMFIVFVFLLIALAAPGWYYKQLNSGTNDQTDSAPGTGLDYESWIGVGIWSTCVLRRWPHTGFYALRCQTTDEFCHTYQSCPTSGPCVAANFCGKVNGAITLLIIAIFLTACFFFFETFGSAGGHSWSCFLSSIIAFFVGILAAASTGIFGSIEKSTQLPAALVSTFTSASTPLTPTKFSLDYKYSFGLIIVAFCLAFISAFLSIWAAVIARRHNKDRAAERARTVQQSGVAL